MTRATQPSSHWRVAGLAEIMQIWPSGTHVVVRLGMDAELANLAVEPSHVGVACV